MTPDMYQSNSAEMGELKEVKGNALYLSRAPVCVLSNIHKAALAVGHPS